MKPHILQVIGNHRLAFL